MSVGSKTAKECSYDVIAFGAFDLLQHCYKLKGCNRRNRVAWGAVVIPWDDRLDSTYARLLRCRIASVVQDDRVAFPRLMRVLQPEGMERSEDARPRCLFIPQLDHPLRWDTQL